MKINYDENTKETYRIIRNKINFLYCRPYIIYDLLFIDG